jgi:class 3 adenylate cyclase
VPSVTEDTQNPQSGAMKLAHVLFMDIVGYSKLPIDEQTSALHILQEIVRGTSQVARAQATNELTSIPTGDGMALVFFDDPTAPVECALEVAKALKSYPEIQLRMGVHSGPVNEIIDVNGRINVAGSGINMAQRVMDSGDAGHILVSKRVAEDLSQYSRWRPLLHDLDEVEVKHAVRVHLFNLVTDDVGNPVLPAAVKKRKKRTVAPWIIAAALAVIIIPTAIVLFLQKPGGQTANPAKPESEFRSLLQKQAGGWVDTVFAAQASDGGIKMSASSAEATTQVWQTAQCLVGALSSQRNLDNYVPRLKSAFKYLEGLHRTEPAEGWNLYGNANKFTITEIGSWVALANLKSLDSKTKIWTDTEREAVISHVMRDLEETVRRQDASGGWRPINDENADFTRTYPTIMALWSLIEARTSPSLSPRVGAKYDENMRRGITWLLRSYKEGQGWVPNPNRVGQKGRFEALTAHALFVLSRAETVDALGYIKSDQIYGVARRDFIKNKQFAEWSIEENNSHMPDADLRFVNTEFLAEGSTFLWFPWTLLELTQLSSDQTLSAAERKAATQLRLDMLNKNADKLENYVESANLMYVLGENLFCVSSYLDRTAEAKTN